MKSFLALILELWVQGLNLLEFGMRDGALQGGIPTDLQCVELAHEKRVFLLEMWKLIKTAGQ